MVTGTRVDAEKLAFEVRDQYDRGRFYFRKDPIGFGVTSVGERKQTTDRPSDVHDGDGGQLKARSSYLSANA